MGGNSRATLICRGDSGQWIDHPNYKPNMHDQSQKKTFRFLKRPDSAAGLHARIVFMR